MCQDQSHYETIPSALPNTSEKSKYTCEHDLTSYALLLSSYLSAVPINEIQTANTLSLDQTTSFCNTSG